MMITFGDKFHQKLLYVYYFFIMLLLVVWKFLMAENFGNFGFSVYLILKEQS